MKVGKRRFGFLEEELEDIRHRIDLLELSCKRIIILGIMLLIISVSSLIVWKWKYINSFFGKNNFPLTTFRSRERETSMQNTEDENTSAGILEVICPVGVNSVTPSGVPVSKPSFFYFTTLSPSFDLKRRSPGATAGVCVIPEGTGSDPLRGNWYGSIVIFCDYSFFSEDLSQVLFHNGRQSIQGPSRSLGKETSQFLDLQPRSRQEWQYCQRGNRTGLFSQESRMRHNLMMTAPVPSSQEGDMTQISRKDTRTQTGVLGSSLFWQKERRKEVKVDESR
jgi:hypothetical protein